MNESLLLGVLLLIQLVCSKVLCYKIVVNIVGVWSDPLTVSLVHQLSFLL
jgi:hypothetical protein